MDSVDPRTLLLIFSIGPLAFMILGFGLQLLRENGLMRKFIQDIKKTSGSQLGIPVNFNELENKLIRFKNRSFLILAFLALAMVFYQAWFRQKEVLIDEQAFIIIVLVFIVDGIPRILRYKFYHSHLTRFQHILLKCAWPAVIVIFAVIGYLLLAYHPFTRGIMLSEVKSENSDLEFGCFIKRLGQGLTPYPGKLRCQYQKYGFEFTTPSKNFFTEINEDQRIRGQNYTTAEPSYHLLRGEYFFEISIYDHKKKQFLTESCALLFAGETGTASAKTTHAGEAEVIRGILPSGGESSTRQAVCYEGKDADILISVAEGQGTDPSIADAILDSLTFKKNE